MKAAIGKWIIRVAFQGSGDSSKRYAQEVATYGVTFHVQ